MRDIRVDGWRIYWRGLRCAFIAETIPGMLYKEMMNALGFLAKPYFFRFQVIPGFSTVSELMAEGLPPKEALEEYARLHGVWGRGKAELVEADLDKPKVVVRIHNSSITHWFMENVKNIKAEFPFYDCSWWGYNWVGAVKAALGEKGNGVPLIYYSTHCSALGDDYCEFSVERSYRGEDPFQNVEKEYLQLLHNYKSTTATAQPPSGNEEIWEFINRLEAGSDGVVKIGRERILFVEGGMYSLAQTLLPTELFGGVVYGAYIKAHVDYGRSLAKQGEKYGVEGVLDFFLSSASSMGWGKLEMVKFEDPEVVFRTYQSIYAETAGHYIRKKGLTRRPVCTYGWIVEGILNYFAKVEGKPPFICREKKCIAKGDEHCEFVLSRQSR